MMKESLGNELARRAIAFEEKGQCFMKRRLEESRDPGTG